MPYLVGIAFPSAGHPDPIRGCAIPGSADRDTHKILIDQWCCVRARSAALLKHPERFVHAVLCWYCFPLKGSS